ncbi:Cyanovirin-N [Xylariomycetidae sp. FL2044]|nr:Cyanovirin-N [Xylariomycetidae sp. FL2044]
MSFSLSSKNIRLEGAVLKADCCKRDGTWQASEIHLDGFLGNIDGVLTWGQADVSKSAIDIWLVGGTKLKALLAAISLDWKEGEVDLDELVENDDGVLRCIK